MKAKFLQFILQKFLGDEKVVVELDGQQYNVEYIKEKSNEIVLVVKGSQ